MINKQFYISSDRLRVLAVDNNSGLVDEFVLMGVNASGEGVIDVKETPHAALLKPKKKYKQRKTKMGKSGMGPGGTMTKEAIAKKLEIGPDDEFMFGKTRRECDALVEASDSLRGEDLEKWAKAEGLNVKQIYQLRSKIRALWEKEADEKRFGKPNPDAVPGTETAADDEEEVA